MIKRHWACLPFIRIIDRLQTDVLLIFKQTCQTLSPGSGNSNFVPPNTVKFGMIPVKRQLGLQEENIFSDKRTIAYAACQHKPIRVRRSACKLCVPRMPSPPTPRIRLSIQLACCCASRTTMGCPSCRTLCIVIRALNVCTSSARTG